MTAFKRPSSSICHDVKARTRPPDTVQDIDMHGTRIRRGDVIFPVIASANRDAQKFAEPDRLDVARKPNPHLAFGDGVHDRLGSHLAKMEAEIAFGCSTRRLP